MIIKLIGKPKSKACREIGKGTNLMKYTGKKSKADVLINYGLAGDRQAQFYNRFPSAKRLPTVNKEIRYSKYTAVKMALNKDIPAPEVKLALDRKDNLDEWLQKGMRSIGGKGIIKAKGKRETPGKYYQRFITNRKYELRVHAFKWIDPKLWKVQKRVGEADVIAWNYKNGGRFISVKDAQNWRVFRDGIEIADKMLDVLSMQFGAVDLLVDNDHKLYFLEVNSAPGFANLSGDIYIDAFNQLKGLPRARLMEFAE